MRKFFRCMATTVSFPFEWLREKEDSWVKFPFFIGNIVFKSNKKRSMKIAVNVMNDDNCSLISTKFTFSHRKVKSRKMIQLADLFSVPEMYLLLTVTEYFNRNHIDYHPEILFRDVKVRTFQCCIDEDNNDGNLRHPRFVPSSHIKSFIFFLFLFLPICNMSIWQYFFFPSFSFFVLFSQNAIGSSHPVMHNIVGNHVREYIKENSDMRKFFERLVSANKKLYLVTNSPFHFV